MDSLVTVDDFLGALLEIAQPLEPFDMPLLDAHGATLASDVEYGEKIVLEDGARIRSTHIALAASLGMDRLPTRPHPRVVIVSAGDDLVEPGFLLRDESDEFEVNSWLLTTAVREAGAVGYRVHTIPDTQEKLRQVIEDQMVRADLIVISGERHDDSFELITATLTEIGEIHTALPAIAESGRHAFGTIGPDRIPVIVLPGDPIGAFLSCELFVRPMILSMLGHASASRTKVRAKLTAAIKSPANLAAFPRALVESSGGLIVTPLPKQSELSSLAAANALIMVPEAKRELAKGDAVEVLIIDRAGN